VLVSSFEQRDNRLTARLELREPRRGRQLAVRDINVPVQDPFSFVDSLYHAALALVHLPMRTQSAQADRHRGAGTLHFLFKDRPAAGAESLESKQRALADFETAYRTEPDHPRRDLAVARADRCSTRRRTPLAHARGGLGAGGP
jgi:hypothetical protein